MSDGNSSEVPILDGIWAVQFRTNRGLIPGTAILEGDRIAGGDAFYHYSGTFCVQNGYIIAEVRVTHRPPPLEGVFFPTTRRYSKVLAPSLGSGF
jgi:T3SS negative regulator,GrlR